MSWKYSWATSRWTCPARSGSSAALAAATDLGLIEPPPALFIAALPLYKMLTNTGLPRPVRVAGEVLESAARPVGSDVIKLQDRRDSDTTVIPVPPGNKRRAR